MRTRSALDAAELEELKERAAFFGLDKSDSFNDFKQKYLKAAEAESQRATMKFTEAISPRVLTNSGSSGIMQLSRGLRIGMDFFGTPSFEKQTNAGIRKSIRSLQKHIIEHQHKIESAATLYPEWDSFSDIEKEGYKRHWAKEIEQFKKQISIAEQELRKRGELP